MTHAGPATQGFDVNSGSLSPASYSTTMKHRTHRRTLPFHIRTHAFAMLALVMVASLCALRAQAQDTLRIVRSFQTIGPAHNSFLSALPDSARWGADVAGIGDLDNDGVPDLAVGQGTYNSNKGAAWIMLMNANGTVKDTALITTNRNGFGTGLDNDDSFGNRLAALGDFNGDTIPDLAVLAPGDDDGATDRGAVYLLFLKRDGAVKQRVKISNVSGSFYTNANYTVNMANNDFGGSLTNLGDVDGDGIQDLAVGAYLSDDGGTDRGALWVLLMQRNGTVKNYRRYSATAGPGWGIQGNPLTSNNAQFGYSATTLGDIDGDGVRDMAVTARMQNSTGTIYVMRLNSNGSVKAYQKIGAGLGGLKLTPSANGGHFGWSIENVGDLNSDGVNDLVASARLQNDGYTQAGTVVVLYLNSDGTVQYEEQIGETHGAGGSLGLHANAYFGFGVSVLGDLDGDKVTDIVVSANAHNGGSGRVQRGEVYLMELNPKPIIATAAITDQTTTTMGAAVLTVKGGVKPYEYIWADSLPRASTFTAWINAVDTVGFAAMGMPSVNKSAFTYAMYKSLFTPKLDSLRAGKYRLAIIDPHGDSASTWLHVGYQLKAATLTGATLSASGDIQKTAAAGWNTMQLATKNLLYANSDGWLQFTLPAALVNCAIGFRPSGSGQSNGYAQMMYAILLSNDSVYAWYEQSKHYSGCKYKPGDTFELARIGSSIVYYKNNKSLRIVQGIDPSTEFIGDVNIYTAGASVTQFRTDLLNTFNDRTAITHLIGLTPASGKIELTVHPSSGTYSYLWSGSGGNAATRTGLTTGNYTVQVTSSWFQNDRTLSYEVGNALTGFKGSPYQLTHDGTGLSIARTSSSIGWSSFGSSANQFTSFRDHWLSFVPWNNDPGVDGEVVGLRADVNSKFVAGWWVHGLGTARLAEAFGANGIVGSIVLRSGDRLRVASTATMTSYALNGKILFNDNVALPSGAVRVGAATRSAGSKITSIATSIPVPLRLNMDHGFSSLSTTTITPDNVTSYGSMGNEAVIDLGTGPRSGDHSISLKDSIGTVLGQFKFQLDSGRVVNLRAILDATTYSMPAHLWENVAPARLVIHDEPEQWHDDAPPTCYLSLEKQVLMTPNGDQLGDVFKVVGADALSPFQVTILDGAGTVLFNSTNPITAWTGTNPGGSPAPSGIYSYHLTLGERSIDGEFILQR